jgi:ATP-dependent helicase YprA (DUF1998 family)
LSEPSPWNVGPEYAATIEKKIEIKRNGGCDGPAWLSSVLPGGPQNCSLPLVLFLRYLQGTMVSQIPGLSIFWSLNLVTAVPSFTHISRRFDHALATQKNIHHEHESQGSESDPTSDLPENTAFSTLRMKVNSDTLRAITEKPFNHAQMSSVQAAVLPLLPELARPHDGDEPHGPPRDLLVKAKTGTGKTLAFLVPAIEARIKAIDKAGVDALEKNGGHPDARVVENAKRSHARKTVGTVVISPTRELATQIAQEATKLTHWHKGFEVKVFTGGSGKGYQLREFKLGRSDIVVATPGRLRDVLENDPDVAEVLTTATHVRARYIQ